MHRGYAPYASVFGCQPSVWAVVRMHGGVDGCRCAQSVSDGGLAIDQQRGGLANAEPVYAESRRADAVILCGRQSQLYVGIRFRTRERRAREIAFLFRATGSVIRFARLTALRGSPFDSQLEYTAGTEAQGSWGERVEGLKGRVWEPELLFTCSGERRARASRGTVNHAYPCGSLYISQLQDYLLIEGQGSKGSRVERLEDPRLSRCGKPGCCTSTRVRGAPESLEELCELSEQERCSRFNRGTS